MQLFGLKTCDTCRKALKSLPEAEFVDVRAKGVPDDVLRRAIDQFGAKLINSRSATWRGRDDDARDLPPEELIRNYPAVMKRPLIDSGDMLHLGWDDTVRAVLGATQAR